jgi:hypothetical protein
MLPPNCVRRVQIHRVIWDLALLGAPLTVTHVGPVPVCTVPATVDRTGCSIGPDR